MYHESWLYIKFGLMFYTTLYKVTHDIPPKHNKILVVRVYILSM